jgi:hypothetical protein
MTAEAHSAGATQKERGMAIETNCPQCGAVYWFTSDLTGKEVTCDECAANFVVSQSVSGTNDGGRPEEGIKSAGARIQGKPPGPRPRVTNEVEATSRQPLKKSGGCSIAQFVIVLAIVLMCGGVVYITFFGYLDGGGKEKEAQVGIQTIEDAVTDFHATHGRWPANSHELVEAVDGKPAKLDTKALIDPWGTPYQYELKNLDPKTQNPRIWSSGEPGARRPISNW